MSFIQLPDILLGVARNPVTAVGLPLVAGFLSGLPTRKVVRGQWYNSLAVPPGRPPKWAFPVVWTTLYVSMGYASHLAVQALDQALTPSTTDSASKGLKLYYGQLALNLIWTPLFFGAKQTGLALVDIVGLTGSVYYMTKTLGDATNGKTNWLLVPYCTWLTLATYLNAGIWWKNRGRSLSKRD